MGASSLQRKKCSREQTSFRSGESTSAEPVDAAVEKVAEMCYEKKKLRELSAN